MTPLLTRYFILFFLLFAGQVMAQSKEQLTSEREKLKKEISYTNELLKKTRKEKEMSVNQIVIYNNLIQKTEQLIHVYNNEVVHLSNNISYLNNDIQKKKSELVTLKLEYAKMIYYAQKNRSSYDRMMYIFASDDFYQAFRRLKYMQQYSQYRQLQAQMIVRKQQELSQKVSTLQNNKVEKESLLVLKEREKQNIDKKKQEKSMVVKQLSGKEAELKKKIKEKELAAQRLNREIQNIIAKEIAEAAAKAKAEKKTTTPAKPGAVPLTPADQVLSNTFSANKGKLPWPTARGIISEYFGTHEHPDMKGIMINNTGINILTAEGSKARAVFNGEVTRIISIPTYNNVVIIKHGDFYTVYTNLDQIYVSKGQQITTKQEIGVIYTDKTTNKTELHFELRQGSVLLNPSLWIVRGN